MRTIYYTYLFFTNFIRLSNDEIVDYLSNAYSCDIVILVLLNVCLKYKRVWQLQNSLVNQPGQAFKMRVIKPSRPTDSGYAWRNI